MPLICSEPSRFGSSGRVESHRETGVQRRMGAATFLRNLARFLLFDPRSKLLPLVLDQAPPSRPICMKMGLSKTPLKDF